ncbi:hypothetical protein KJ865_13895, partial [Myxococcota bacterium]|nr:hypothetical protein [Myxococcota bacterium]
MVKSAVLFVLLLLLVSCSDQTTRKIETVSVASRNVAMPQKAKTGHLAMAQRSQVRQRALPHFVKSCDESQLLTYQGFEARLSQNGFEKDNAIPVLLMGLGHREERVRERAKKVLEGIS